MSKASIEIIRRVYDEDEGRFITVGPDPDGLDAVQISVEESEKDYWGEVCLTLSPALARKLAEALIARAGEAEGDTPTP